MSAYRRRRTALAGLMLSPGLAMVLGACTTLGSNIEGSFACRAPGGTCAPTTVIDSGAIGQAGASDAPAIPARATANSHAANQSGARTLRIVIAATRDAAGRTHEARVVHVPLPEGPAASWRAPRSSGEVLRALGHAAAPDSPLAETAPGPAPASPASDRSFLFPLQLPDGLATPSQGVPELPGASAPVTGAPGRPPSPDRVPHMIEPEGDRP